MLSAIAKGTSGNRSSNTEVERSPIKQYTRRGLSRRPLVRAIRPCLPNVVLCDSHRSQFILFNFCSNEPASQFAIDQLTILQFVV